MAPESAAAAAGELRRLGTELDRAAEGITRRLRRPARAARSTPAAEAASPGGNQSNRIESRGGGRAPNSSPAPNSSTNPDLGSSNRKRIEGGRGGGIRGWDLRRGSGESFLFGGFLAPRTLRKSARTRACARTRSRTNGDSKSYAAGGAERGKTKTKARGKGGEQPRPQAPREFFCAREGYGGDGKRGTRRE